MKKKTKSLNYKRKYKTLKKDWEEHQKDKLNSKKKLLDLMQLSEKFKTLTSQKLTLSRFWLGQPKSETLNKNTTDSDHNWVLFQVLSTLNFRNLEPKESDLNMKQTLTLY